DQPSGGPAVMSEPGSNMPTGVDANGTSSSGLFRASWGGGIGGGTGWDRSYSHGPIPAPPGTSRPRPSRPKRYHARATRDMIAPDLNGRLDSSSGPVWDGVDRS